GRGRFRWWWGGAAAAVGVVVLALAMGGGSKSAPLIRAAEPIDEVARLVKRAAEGDTPGERQSAFDRLVALGHSDKVPWVPMLARGLQGLPAWSLRRPGR